MADISHIAVELVVIVSPHTLKHVIVRVTLSAHDVTVLISGSPCQHMT